MKLQTRPLSIEEMFFDEPTILKVYPTPDTAIKSTRICEMPKALNSEKILSNPNLSNPLFLDSAPWKKAGNFLHKNWPYILGGTILCGLLGYKYYTSKKKQS